MELIRKLFNTKLVQNSLWLFVLQVFNTIVPMLTIPYITRVLGSDGYGIFSLSLNWVLYFQVIVEYGFGFTGARKVSLLDEKKLQKIYSVIITARVILIVITFTFLNIVYWLSQMPISHYICMLILFTMVIGLAFQLTWLFQGKQDMKFITIINAISRTISVILVFLLVKSPQNIYLYCFLYSCTYILSSLIGILVAKKKYSLRVKFCGINDALYEIKDGWYLFISQAMSKIISGFGITILGMFSSMNIVGIYSAIYKIPYILVMFFSPISQALYPHVSIAFAKSFEQGEKVVKKYAGIIIVFFSGCGLVIILCRNFIVKIAFGQEYVHYSVIIIPLTIWFILSILNNFLGIQFLVASGHQKEYSNAFFIAAIISIIFNIILGYCYGIYGISIAATVGELSLIILLAINIFKIKTR